MTITKNEHTDEQIMLLLQRGSREALSILYDRYYCKIVNYFYRMLNKDNDKAKDFTQDLFLKIINNPDSFDCSKKFSAWIYTIANNMCKNEYKKMSIRKEHRNEENYIHQNKKSYIEDKIDGKLFKNNLEESLEHLDENHKTIFLLRFQQELSIREISEIIKCPVGTVKSRLFYTIKTLSEKLKVFDPQRN
jgi:RNA polymerase sigma-70 factor, ECF subfamily